MLRLLRNEDYTARMAKQAQVRYKVGMHIKYLLEFKTGVRPQIYCKTIQCIRSGRYADIYRDQLIPRKVKRWVAVHERLSPTPKGRLVCLKQKLSDLDILRIRASKGRVSNGSR